MKFMQHNRIEYIVANTKRSFKHCAILMQKGSVLAVASAIFKCCRWILKSKNDLRSTLWSVLRWLLLRNFCRSFRFQCVNQRLVQPKRTWYMTWCDLIWGSLSILAARAETLATVSCAFSCLMPFDGDAGIQISASCFNFKTSLFIQTASPQC